MVDKSLALSDRMFVPIWIRVCGRRMGFRSRPLIRNGLGHWAVHRITANNLFCPMGEIASDSSIVEKVASEFETMGQQHTPIRQGQVVDCIIMHPRRSRLPFVAA